MGNKYIYYCNEQDADEECYISSDKANIPNSCSQKFGERNVYHHPCGEAKQNCWIGVSEGVLRDGGTDPATYT